MHHHHHHHPPLPSATIFLQVAHTIDPSCKRRVSIPLAEFMFSLNEPSTGSITQQSSFVPVSNVYPTGATAATSTSPYPPSIPTRHALEHLRFQTVLGMTHRMGFGFVHPPAANHTVAKFCTPVKFWPLPIVKRGWNGIAHAARRCIHPNPNVPMTKRATFGMVGDTDSTRLYHTMRKLPHTRIWRLLRLLVLLVFHAWPLNAFYPSRRISNHWCCFSPIAITSPTTSTTTSTTTAWALQDATSSLNTDNGMSYSERSRPYRRDLFNYDDWVQHRSSKRFIGP
jgi:hypothetical protein